MLDTDQINKIRGRCENATPGSWKQEVGWYIPQADVSIVASIMACSDANANGSFIAHAREDIPALLDALNESKDEWSSRLVASAERESKIAQERDRWKARCRAIERAIGQCAKERACDMCVHTNFKRTQEPCSYCSYPECGPDNGYEFDEARFV